MEKYLVDTTTYLLDIFYSWTAEEKEYAALSLLPTRGWHSEAAPGEKKN